MKYLGVKYDTMADWETIKLPRDMVKRIEDVANSKYAKELGFTSKSQVAVTAVREFLRQYSEFMGYIELKDITDDVVVLHDHKLETDINVKVHEGKLSCDWDKGRCKHVDFVSMLPRIQSVMEE